MNESKVLAPISFKGTVSKHDFSRVQSMLLPVWARWYIFIPCVLYVSVSIGVGWSKVISDPTSAVSDLAWGAALVILSASITKYGRIKAWRNMVSFTGEIHGVATEEGIEWNTANTKTSFEWRKFLKVRQEADLSLAFYTPRCAFYFPKNFFASDLDWQAFNSLLQSQIRK